MLDLTDINNISQGFELNPEDLVSKERILELLSIRIGQLIKANPDRLFSLLYRLDISEQNIKSVLNLGEDIELHLAELIYHRQIEKAESRKRFKSQKGDEDELSW